MFPPSINSSGSVPVSSGTYHKSFQTSHCGGSLLGGESLASHSSQHVGRHSSSVSLCKGSHHGCFGWPCTQMSTTAAFNPLAVHRCVLCIEGLSSTVGQWQRQLECLQCRTTKLERIDGLVLSLGCTQLCNIYPLIS